MKIELLLLLRFLQQRGWTLSIPLGVLASPLLLALPSWRQTSNPMPSTLNGDVNFDTSSLVQGEQEPNEETSSDSQIS